MSRYSPRKRSKILAFVRAHDEEHGRGGMAQAVRKFKVSFLTVRTWMKKVPAAQKPTDQPKPRIIAQPKSGKTGLVNKVAAAFRKIESLEKDIASKKALVVQEKKALSAFLKI